MMKRNLSMLIMGFVIAVLFVLLQIVFTVRQGECAVVTTFGKPVRSISEPGLYGRWPWPVQRVYRFDQRLQTLSGSFEEVLTQDGKNILLAVFAGWRIQDPTLFLERVGTVEQAEFNLDGLLRTFKNSTTGRYKFSEFINTDTAQLKLADIEKGILEAVAREASARYGIEVQSIGIRKLGLPEAITQSVFDRMRAERQELADRYRSEGEGESIKLRAQADSSRDQLLAKADADAKRIRAEGDAEAAEFYTVFEQDPELAMFLKKLEVMEETLKEKATVVLSAESEPFDLLKGRQGAGFTTKGADAK